MKFKKALKDFTRFFYTSEEKIEYGNDPLFLITKQYNENLNFVSTDLSSNDFTISQLFILFTMR